MEDEKIILQDTRNADSRTALDDFTIDELREATKTHIREVGECMDFFANKLHKAGKIHDWTKLDNFAESYDIKTCKACCSKSRCNQRPKEKIWKWW